MVESVLAVLIVGVMMVAALNMVGMSARSRSVNARLGKGPALAHALLGEVLQAYYADPDTIPTLTEGPEVELSSHDPSGGNSEKFVVRSKDWVAQFFQPTLPADAQSWSLTRVRFKARAQGSKNGVASVQIRPADGSGFPDATVIEQYPLDESTLNSSFKWLEYNFGGVSKRSVGSGLFLTIVAQVDDSKICSIELEDDTESGSGLFETYGAGAPWQSRDKTAMYYYVFGKISTETIPPPTIGTDTGEGSSSRTDFDDVDDYHGWSASPPQDRGGSDLVDYAGWTRSVTVEYVNPVQPGSLGTASDGGAKRITVTVTDPRGAQTTIVGVRSRMGAYEQDVETARTYISWVGLDLQLGAANAALSLGTALVNEPLAN